MISRVAAEYLLENGSTINSGLVSRLQEALVVSGLLTSILESLIQISKNFSQNSAYFAEQRFTTTEADGAWAQPKLFLNEKPTRCGR